MYRYVNMRLEMPLGALFRLAMAKIHLSDKCGIRKICILSRGMQYRVCHLKYCIVPDISAVGEGTNLKSASIQITQVNSLPIFRLFYTVMVKYNLS